MKPHAEQLERDEEFRAAEKQVDAAFLDLERCLQGAVVHLVAEKSRGFNMRGFNQGALIIDLSEAYRPAGEGPLERSLRQRSGRFRIGRWQSPPRGLSGFGFRAFFVFSGGLATVMASLRTGT
ncbi:MAG: hypothetical protein E5V92_28055 [Mesorhizobium sp.]|uniref:hypothetical protein n=1 Tax=Mesorhizobium sp. M1D.F.Ca.ET.043.01.1.1 TaxID=2493669 RepID=UPI000F760262|nr:hypothetical protein [Mesorhizobium sp. M1D.F.Ca.ET.043.01.1.1]AZO75481.1 hypothetical protein EJ067_33100 [Mesorhizobium sp. M1D.F.Ca.ET.043.01.1.1]TJW77881.1 MAG: hypothetical protein E5V92_28055 [Mesorhizobium sp.]